MQTSLNNAGAPRQNRRGLHQHEPSLHDSSTLVSMFFSVTLKATLKARHSKRHQTGGTLLITGCLPMAFTTRIK